MGITASPAISTGWISDEAWSAGRSVKESASTETGPAVLSRSGQAAPGDKTEKQSAASPSLSQKVNPFYWLNRLPDKVKVPLMAAALFTGPVAAGMYLGPAGVLVGSAGVVALSRAAQTSWPDSVQNGISGGFLSTIGLIAGPHPLALPVLAAIGAGLGLLAVWQAKHSQHQAHQKATP